MQLWDGSAVAHVACPFAASEDDKVPAYDAWKLWIWRVAEQGQDAHQALCQIAQTKGLELRILAAGLSRDGLLDALERIERSPQRGKFPYPLRAYLDWRDAQAQAGKDAKEPEARKPEPPWHEDWANELACLRESSQAAPCIQGISVELGDLVAVPAWDHKPLADEAECSAVRGWSPCGQWLLVGVGLVRPEECAWVDKLSVRSRNLAYWQYRRLGRGETARHPDHWGDWGARDWSEFKGCEGCQCVRPKEPSSKIQDPGLSWERCVERCPELKERPRTILKEKKSDKREVLVFKTHADAEADGDLARRDRTWAEECAVIDELVLCAELPEQSLFDAVVRAAEQAARTQSRAKLVTPSFLLGKALSLVIGRGRHEAGKEAERRLGRSLVVSGLVRVQNRYTELALAVCGHEGQGTDDVLEQNEKVLGAIAARTRKAIRDREAEAWTGEGEWRLGVARGWKGRWE